ncbi:MAG TPA: DUF4123 domain-containing protein [Phnomibacter sp.]|nr:DUF4123 domain-containing protein [Phnomibacter sp.]
METNAPNFAIIDGARALSRIASLTDTGIKHQNLYKGKQGDALAPVAPYLFEYHLQHAVHRAFCSNALGNAWGLLCYADVSFEEMHMHLRKLLVVQTEAYKKLYFRFYDPRVLRIFLPTCNAAQLVEIFGPVQYFLMEDDEPDNLIKFWLEHKSLQYQRMALPPHFVPQPQTEDVQLSTLPAQSAANHPQAAWEQNDPLATQNRQALTQPTEEKKKGRRFIY